MSSYPTFFFRLSIPPFLVSAARKPLTGNEILEKESISQLFQLPSLDKQETWFPTLRKTIWVLSQLHDFVKPAIFEDIAQEAVSLCRQSLIVASEQIRSSKTALDAQLFLARHLLILKEMAKNLVFGREGGGGGGADGDGKGGIDLGSVTGTFFLCLGSGNG